MPIRLLVIVAAALTACTYEAVDLTGLDGCADGQSGCGDFGLNHDDPPGHVGNSDGEPGGGGGDSIDSGDATGADSAPADEDDPCADTACAPCDGGAVRPAGIAGDCCPACQRVDSGCTNPPRQCSGGSGCAPGDQCVEGFCGQYDAANNVLTISNGSQCIPSTCWDNFDHYRGDCCPSCTIQCGASDACAPEDCVGPSCNCDPSKLACTEVVCECTI